MKLKPVQLFGLIMSVVYVLFGTLTLLTNFLANAITDPLYRQIFGCAFIAYGLFRVTLLIKKLREKS
jgi:hypothetical protein